MVPTRQEFREAKKRLIEAGWEEGCTIMSGDVGDKNYGTSFTKEGKEFYLNKDTIQEVE